jgi:hypothetical protein
MFQTCSVHWPASPFICGHLCRHCCGTWISRISAQIRPHVTHGRANIATSIAGELTEHIDSGDYLSSMRAAAQDCKFLPPDALRR